ncbi:hypothetical protein DMB92_02610 [Campylobacter sp. MIT 99-7217]|uniref:hypothetical protein n=1 Tax=Campylobacter sp. MIT 99-7217 TaxID=535091 RepID=UPI0011570969|nr:hypothetical protein [Campylobacter sp. MIT 99-7217]TQR33793.1 hypothetical protein DMB92_02610 [Campylobacter sp. MIT 99-7217]
MSGFIGFKTLIVYFELALEVKLNKEQEKILKKLLLPLSDKNVFALCKKDLDSFLDGLDFSFLCEDTKKAKHFLSRFLLKNLKDMI